MLRRGVRSFPSDHHYFEPSVFRAPVRECLRLARYHCDKILIIGAPSTYPEVDYGWIQPGPTVADTLQFVSGFREKPSREEATLLYRKGCLWNTFVMIGCAGSFLELLQATLPHFVATIGLGFSAASLDGRYAAIGTVDFFQRCAITSFGTASCIARRAFWLDGFR
jgi:mannose-1-phosphate guanylyltransferase